MTTKFAALKKSAGVAVLLAAMTGAGLGLGSGIAQADTMNPDPNHQVITTINQIHDQFVNRVNRDLMRINGQFDRHCARFDARLDRRFEGTLTDRIVDHVCGTP
jgi:hypothetical protein